MWALGKANKAVTIVPPFIQKWREAENALRWEIEISDYRELNQTWCWCFCNHFSIIQSYYANLAKCVPITILELNWKYSLRDKKAKLNICHHMLTYLSTQLQNRSFHLMERTRMSAKCQKMKNAGSKHAKVFFFALSNMQYHEVLVSIVVVTTSAPYH